MSGSSLSTKVLEADGRIETRMKHPDYDPVTQYVFTKESLERFIEIIKQEQSNDTK
jgi:hypothetical protein